MSQIEHPLILEGERVRLIPLQKEHLPELIEAGKESIIWEQLPIDGSRKGSMAMHVNEAILKRVNGDQYPFSVVDKIKNKIIGTTRFFEIFLQHKKLEIGWTWYDPDYWGRGYNTECKLLLLTYCFEQLKLNRVQFKTRNTNFRSAAAIKKIGAKFEGIMRKDRIMPDSVVRDTMIFSIIDEDWKDVKPHLEHMLLLCNIKV